MRTRSKDRAKQGHYPPKHFTGKKGGKPIRRKGTSRKQRKLIRGTHISKF